MLTNEHAAQWPNRARRMGIASVALASLKRTILKSIINLFNFVRIMRGETCDRIECACNLVRIFGGEMMIPVEKVSAEEWHERCFGI